MSPKPTRGWIVTALFLVTAIWLATVSRAEPRPTSRPARAVDEDLVRRLLGGKSTALDTMESTLARMDDAAGRLTMDFDTGDTTQAIQEKIVKGIDAMIKDAEQRRRAAKQGRGQRRRRPRPSPKAHQPGSRRDFGSRGPTPARRRANKDDKARRGARRDKVRLKKSDLARRWGFLPERDRAELLQGFDEEFLPKYREEILRYYRNLVRDGARK